MDCQDKIRCLLKAAGLKITRQREEILSVLAQTDRGITAEEIYQQSDRDYGLATVYRTLAVLLEHKIVERADLPGSSSQYYRLAGESHRHHLICTCCKKDVVIDGCPAQEMLKALGDQHGFQVTGHSFEIFGLCPDCQKKRG